MCIATFKTTTKLVLVSFIWDLFNSIQFRNPEKFRNSADLVIENRFAVRRTTFKIAQIQLKYIYKYK